VSRSPVTDLARAAEYIYRKMLIERLTGNPRITILPSTQITRVGVSSVEIRGADGATRELRADRVIVAQGRDPLVDMIAGIDPAIRVFVIGDSRRTGRIGNAVHDAYAALQMIAASHSRAGELAC
jgi:thioredoxin reductase